MKMAPLTKYLTYQLYHALQLLAKITKEGDTEYLHQFRIAIRRSRSLLRLYLPEYYALQEVLRTAVRQTNILRELDVFIESVDPVAYPKLIRVLHHYRNEQFETLLTDHFREQTRHALNKLYDDLTGLNPVIEDERLIAMAEKHYQGCLSDYNALTKKCSEEELHELRIRFKITRYALEFLEQSELHSEKEKIKSCKKIQDHLGAVQDAANQLQFLKSFCKAHTTKECRQLLKDRKTELKHLKKLTVSNR
jgi:CHAD domain-containing protein